jgi:hypothetical protein
MITDAASKIAKLACKRVDLPLGKPNFQPKERYKSKDFDVGNFKKLERSTQDSHTRDLRIACLDGGNLPIIQAPSFAVHFERVYFNCFEGEKRVTLQIPNKLEFFVVVTSLAKGDEIKYETSLVPLNEEQKKFLPDEKDLVFDSYDETISTGGEQIQIPRIGDIARSFAEWKYARFVVDELDKGDIFVRDGTLHAPYTNQSAYADKAYEAARKNEVLFAGVSKTSHLYTTSGLPLAAAISRLARENNIEVPWYYKNIVDITDPAHKADISFAKLNKHSDYVFRIELLKGLEAQRDTLMRALASQSNDVSFPGYPYGLVDADKNARVSYDELDSLRMLLLSEISKQGFKDFKELLAASDAHDWLNEIV